MKINRVELTVLSIEMHEPYSVAYSDFTHADNIFIRLDSDRFSGWGCIAPDPDVTGETIPEIYEKASSLLPELLTGEDYLRRALLMRRLKRRTPGLYSLWAGVDTALWDLLGKKAGIPVWKIIGGYREKIRSSITIGICSLEKTMTTINRYTDEGWEIIKLKGGLDVDDDIARLKRIRKDYGRRLKIRFDANQGYTPGQALYFIEQTKDLHIELLEQPTMKSRPDLLGVVTRKSPIPVMADESMISLFDAFHLVKNGLADLMNIKLMKAGGITEAIQVDAVARAAGVEVMVGCMDEAALGVAAGLHFALSRPNIRFADLDGHIDLINDPSSGAVRYHNGYLYPAAGPGFGWNGM